jgi:ribosomal protein S12 methylthiotransferase accessory factor
MNPSEAVGASAPHGMCTAILRELDAEVRIQPATFGSGRVAHFRAIAHTRMSSEIVHGTAVDQTPDLARLRALMECAERSSQFHCVDPRYDAIETYRALRSVALSPMSCGLYSRAQYDSEDFACARFSERDRLQWMEVEDLAAATRWLLPAEFVFPRARLDRKPLVVETSSGTAAHVCRKAATLAALCEVIERDKFMQFWYRQPPTTVLRVDDIGREDLLTTISDVQGMGYVVTVCRLEYDLPIPCYMVIGLKGETFAVGLGCRPDALEALGHAVGEFCGGIIALQQSGPHAYLYQPLLSVQRPEDHYALYNRGPLHHLLREVLNRVLQPDVSAGSAVRSVGMAADPLEAVLDVLGRSGYRTFACDITSPRLARCGIVVMRVFVPGLIPLHFGHDRLRLGCARLWQSAGGGRLATLLPHFLY